MSTDPLWTAIVDGQQQPGVVKAKTAEKAAVAWAEFIDLDNEECEIEVKREGSAESATFTVECERTYTAFRHAHS